MTYSFDIKTKEKIINAFGSKFYIGVESIINPFIDQWKIDALHLIDSFSASLVFQGESNLYGPIVMKFGRIHDEFSSEVKALGNFEGRGVCKLFEADYDNKVLLEESINPGTTLQSEKDIDIRLGVFCDLYKQLHQEVKALETINLLKNQAFKYKSYKDWVVDITDFMDQQDAWQDVALHMKRAKELFLELSMDYGSESLLHGDFHYYNILKGEDGYKIIDPKGVLGNPIFDIPRYMLNEFWDEENDLLVDSTIQKVFNVIGQNIGIAKDVLSKLLYIEGTMALCWNIEDGIGIDEKEDILDAINWLASYVE